MNYEITEDELKELQDKGELTITINLVKKQTGHPSGYKPYEGVLIPKGVVIYNTDYNYKFVTLEEIRNDEKYLFVCDRPHGDDDFSYMCGCDYCRCMQ